MRITRAKLSSMNQENQLLQPKNRLNKQKMVNPSRLLEIKLNRQKNKLLKLPKFSMRNKKLHQLF